jgi:hypothetical protein
MAANDPGAAAGAAAAKCLLDQRLAENNANRNTPDSFRGGTGVGDWRPTVLVAGVPIAMAADFLARTRHSV